MAKQPESDQQIQIGTPAPRCAVCGGREKDAHRLRCRACAADWPVELIFENRPELFRRAEAVLSRSGLVQRITRPQTLFVSRWGSVQTSPGIIAIASDAQNEVARLLEEHGVEVPHRGVPFIDRGEPVCPQCHGDVSSSRNGHCPNCGQPFVWLDEHEALFRASDEVEHERHASSSGWPEREHPHHGLGGWHDPFAPSPATRKLMRLATLYRVVLAPVIGLIGVLTFLLMMNTVLEIALAGLILSIFAIYLRRPIGHWLKQHEERDLHQRW